MPRLSDDLRVLRRSGFRNLLFARTASMFGTAMAPIAVGTTRILGPVIAAAHLGGASAWATIVSAQALGFLVGSAVVIRVRASRPRVAATFSCFAFVPFVVALALGAPLWLIVVASFIDGVSHDIFGVLWDTALQTHIPTESLSRVSAYDSLGSFVLGPIGLAAIGPIADAVGVRTAFAVGGSARLARNGCRLPQPRGPSPSVHEHVTLSCHGLACVAYSWRERETWDDEVCPHR